MVMNLPHTSSLQSIWERYASWQKGAIENTNKLIRQYIPKQANFDDFTDKKIASILKKMIYKIQLIENKQVTLFVKLNR